LAKQTKGAGWTRGEIVLLGLLRHTARGPKRGGLFALWLVLRVAMTLCGPSVPSERSRRRHLIALERRLSSLPMSQGVRRALQAALMQLQDGTPEAAAIALRQLVAPAEDLAGPEAGKALARAADTARRIAKAGTAL
jgi:hypothetical protein